MRSARLLTLAAAAALLTGCGTPTVTSTPDAVDTAAQEAAISAPSGAPTVGGENPSPQESATPSASLQAAGVGDAITLKDDSGDLKISVKLSKVVEGQAANDMVKADAGKRLYGVEVILKNVGTDVLEDSPGGGAKIVDDEGQEYDKSTFGEIAGQHNLGHITLAPGKIRKGVIVFEVPKKAKITEFMMALSSGLADQKGSWTIK